MGVRCTLHAKPLVPTSNNQLIPVNKAVDKSDQLEKGVE
jgi:hypothetical protein